VEEARGDVKWKKEERRRRRGEGEGGIQEKGEWETCNFN
jgi:hypothetical protein